MMASSGALLGAADRAADGTGGCDDGANSVVVTAMGCRYAGGADSPEALWELLAKGAAPIGEVDRKRWRDQQEPEPKKWGEDEAVFMGSSSVPAFAAGSYVGGVKIKTEGGGKARAKPASRSSSRASAAAQLPQQQQQKKKRGRDDGKPLAECVEGDELPRVVAAALAEPEAFDNEHFQLTEGEAAAMDPQHRLVLEVAAQAFHRAGYSREALKGQRVGVWVALSNQEWGELPAGRLACVAAAARGEGFPPTATHAAQRVSHFYRLRGPSVVLNAGCSSALVAVEEAAAALRQGRCTIALVVGAHLLLGKSSATGWQKVGLASTTGDGAVFAPRGEEGFVPGEGAGAVLLEMAAQARARGHTGRLARLRAVSVAYGGSPFHTAPDTLQEELLELIESAPAAAGLARPGGAAQLVDYAEISGAGRTVYDAREAECLAKVYGGAAADGAATGAGQGQGLVLGCVKANLGHMDAGSGMAGLLKALLVLEHRAAPPQPRLPDGPHETFVSLGVTIPCGDQPVPLAPEGNRPLRVAVTSLAWSGTNAHVLVEECGSVEDDGVESMLSHEEEEEKEGVLRRRDLPPLELRRKPFPWWHVEHPPLELYEDSDEEDEEGDYEALSQDSEATRRPRVPKRPKVDPVVAAEERRARARAAKREQIVKLMNVGGGKRPRRDHDMPQFLDAVRARDVEAVEMWLQEGYKVLGDSLMLAVRKGLFDIVKLMFEKGNAHEYCLTARVPLDDKEDYRGAYLIHFAVLNDQPEMIKLLATYMKKQHLETRGTRGGWNPATCKDYWGYTPMHYAVKHRKPHTIATLMELEHDLTKMDNAGNPPMLWIDPNGMGCLDELLKHQADINITDKGGLTLLYWTITNQTSSEHRHLALHELAVRLIALGAQYGEKMEKNLLADLALNIETREDKTSELYVPVLIGDGPYDPKASLPPSIPPPPSAASLGMGGGAASPSPGGKRGSLRAAAAASAAAEEDEEDVSEEDGGAADSRPLLLAPPPGVKFPLFAYLMKAVGNPIVPACKGCNCRGACAINPECACRKKSQDGTGPYTADGLLKWPSPMTISECGPTCACNEGCGLRKTARGLGVPVEVRWTGNRGWGVFTRTRVRKGAYIGSYLGEYLSQKMAQERYDVVKAEGGNPDYQVEIELEGRKLIVIDATYGGNVTRLINHSCEPNCYMKKVNNGTMYPTAAFFAGRDIAKGEELTFNYDPQKNKGGAKKRGKDATMDDVACHCGASRCRGTV